MIEPITYQMINATGELVAFCDQARTQGWIALDTEFVRTRTLYAELGLVQAKAGDSLILIDPLNGVDLAPLWALLRDPHVLTVVHAGGEDLEILHQKQGTPATLFDTQIAYAFLTDGSQIGYAGLVEQMLQVTVDKSQSRTDWLQRPLTQAQLTYAAADVAYLSEIYPRLRSQAVAEGKEALIMAECAEQIERRGRELPAALAWRDIGGLSLLDGPGRAVLKALAEWRLKTAREKNVALPFIAKDHILVEIARTQPSSRYALSTIDDLHPMALRRYADAILDCVERGLAMSVDEQPEPIPRYDQDGDYKRYFKAAKAALKEIGESQGIPVSLLGSRKQLNDVYVWERFLRPSTRAGLPAPDLYSGWRGTLVRDALKRLIQTSQKT
ncbi:ribonuclease D [Aliidiomarina sanyensis]|uniref:Ribonuclease D n=1 Tax=Aliidiomarina sanyensis TaxID=1249555 RepID=A0A432WNH8_9GAMM|nr:ribonuclease D [Aliidiomarina sanyensis]RUO35334.1 ribonuclease D [Aliidiomarina sanyensis]